ncbi:14225_t:CDS:2 [Racocetra fulgida]|uniref:14225_t:CDS:1 n=1 Tax=Racocetra fulgida TaxID=60492 RepID=A0A9N8YT95_9GLOM|nr:14225_t:CDS:2 [Racocetra fulgida]
MANSSPSKPQAEKTIEAFGDFTLANNYSSFNTIEFSANNLPESPQNALTESSQNALTESPQIALSELNQNVQKES